MVGVHHAVAFAVLAATFGAAAAGAWTYYRRQEARGLLTHSWRWPRHCSSRRSGSGSCSCRVTIAQRTSSTTCTGRWSLLAVLAPWMYAPADRRGRLALVHRGDVGGRSARGAGVHDCDMSRFFSGSTRSCAGMLILAAIAVVIVVFPARADAARARHPRAGRLHPRDRLLRLPHVARAAGGDLAVAAACAVVSSTVRRSVCRRGRRPLLVRRSRRLRGLRLRGHPRALRVRRCGAPGATSTRTCRKRLGLDAGGTAPSSAASASRIGT